MCQRAKSVRVRLVFLPLPSSIPPSLHLSLSPSPSASLTLTLSLYLRRISLSILFCKIIFQRLCLSETPFSCLSLRGFVFPIFMHYSAARSAFSERKFEHFWIDHSWIQMPTDYCVIRTRVTLVCRSTVHSITCPPYKHTFAYNRHLVLYSI